MSDTPANPPQGPKPDFQDITLYDQDTGEPFTFTAKEQEFFWRQGFTNVPRRSPERRKLMRDKRAKGKPIFNVVCKVCGKVGKLLVEPHNPKDIYCETCFTEAWTKYLEAHPDKKAEYEKAEAEAAALAAQYDTSAPQTSGAL